MKKSLAFIFVTFVLLSSCKKEPTKVIPKLTTISLTSITETSVKSGGNITDNGGSAVFARGVCWGATENPTIENSKTTDGIGSGEFISSVTGLDPGVTYYFRAYAANSVGTAYGAQITTTTIAFLPTLNTNQVTGITSTTATSVGVITNDGGAPITARGICWNIFINPTLSNSKTIEGAGNGSFTSAISGLSQNTKYYFRAYATNITGTSYGENVEFTTSSEILFNGNLTYGTVPDIEGNIYKTIQIGDQIWMAENLKTTKYNDGTSISNVEGSSFPSLTGGAYCWYNDNVYNKNIYGALYNWYTVNTGKLAPTGWHVPTNEEWNTLTTYLGGVNVTGLKIKEAGHLHWGTDNLATNESGFSGLPCGVIDIYGVFKRYGVEGTWWSSTGQTDAKYAWLRSTDTTSPGLYKDYTSSYKQNGYAVRCVKN
ncbi:MAG TPA: fibrobacter succinogenes major paralogous domain-containing protein [Paludibacter sp.]